MNTYTLKIALEAGQFTGTGQWYRHFLGILLTDGVRWLREKLECYWLIDDIALFSRNFWNKETFMTADYSRDNGKAILNLTDGNGRLLFSNNYAFTDLHIDNHALSKSGHDPLLRFFLVYDGGFKKHVLLLPSEY